jgi:hypothetical protein
MSTTTPLTLTDVLNAYQALQTLNATYLGWSITIILAAGGFFYLFNFKPLQDSIVKQEKEFRDVKDDIESKIAAINTSFATLISTQTTELRASVSQTSNEVGELKKDALQKINEAKEEFSKFTTKAEKELTVLKTQYQTVELRRMWDEQYMWDSKNVLINSVRTLIEFVEESFKVNIWIVSRDLWLDRTLGVLKRLEDYDAKDAQTVRDRLMTYIEKIPGNEGTKKDLQKEIDRLFKKP